MIKKHFVNTPKPGYPFDRNARKHFSYGIDIWINGDRKQERGFTTRARAEAAIERLKSDAKAGKFGIVADKQIPFLVELFQKKLDDTESKHDRARAKRVFDYFLNLPGVPKKIKANELRTAHLQLYVNARTEDGVSAQTIRREMVPIVAALKSAFKYFVSLDDYRPPRIPRPRVAKNKKERIIYPHEQDALFAYFFAPKFAGEIRQEPRTRRRTGQFLLMCLLTLSRPGEMARLTRTNVDLTTGIIEIEGRKSRFKSTQIVRRLKITPTMRAILDERFKLAKGDYLFTYSGYVTPDMYESFKAACEHCGIKYSRTAPDGISFHTARHTGITMLVQSGMDIKTIGQLAGHSDALMTMHYSHPNPALVVKAGELLEDKMARNLTNSLPA